MVQQGFGGVASIGFLNITFWIGLCVIYEVSYRTKHFNTYHFDKLTMNWEKKLAKYTPEKLEFEVDIGTPLCVFD